MTTPPISPIHILIVEDEFTIALDIENRLENMGYRVIGIADNYDDALALATKEQPQVILMDINIRGKQTGIDTAMEIYKNYHIPIIFLTALADDASFSQAMTSQPYGYITKPFKDATLKHNIEIALQKYKQLQDYQYIAPTNQKQLKLDDMLFVKDKNRLVSIILKEILWIEAFDNYAIIVLPTQKILVSSTLKDLLDRLPSEYFMRIHRSYIIQLLKIKRIEDNDIYISEKPLPVSKSYRDELISRLNII